MKLSDYKDTYDNFSSKASDVARSLSFAGIAVIWIFKIEDGDHIKIPVNLFCPLLFFALGLTFDLLHYSIGALIWGIFHRCKEKQVQDVKKNPDTDAPAWINYPTLTFFWGKIFSVIFGYYFLLRDILGKLS
jgi:hypothetical protein